MTGKVGGFLQAMKEKLASSLEQELFHGPVFRKADRAVVGVCGLTRVPYPLQKVSAHSPVGLIMRDSLQIHRVQNCEPCFRSVRFGNRGGISNLRVTVQFLPSLSV